MNDEFNFENYKAVTSDLPTPPVSEPVQTQFEAEVKSKSDLKIRKIKKD